VDQEHQRLFALAAQMQAAMLAGQGKPILVNLLE